MAENFRPILGIKFYVGTMPGLLELTSRGGLVVAPAAPALVDLPTDNAYRQALENSDFAITDSGFMVLLWALIECERLPRISGLRFLSALFRAPGRVTSGTSFWVMPSEAEMTANLAWLRSQGHEVTKDHCYLAPHYAAGSLQDTDLLKTIETHRPVYVIISLGGGVQERLGYFLRRNLSYRPAILCTGAAIAFLSKQQANIPPWADRIMLGWLLRILYAPRKFLPRYWKALRLVPILWKHRKRGVQSSEG